MRLASSAAYCLLQSARFRQRRISLRLSMLQSATFRCALLLVVLLSVVSSPVVSSLWSSNLLPACCSACGIRRCTPPAAKSQSTSLPGSILPGAVGRSERSGRRSAVGRVPPRSRRPVIAESPCLRRSRTKLSTRVNPGCGGGVRGGNYE